jgi:hypothetical protein
MLIAETVHVVMPHAAKAHWMAQDGVWRDSKALVKALFFE